jgi:hypothetical protein
MMTAEQDQLQDIAAELDLTFAKMRNLAHGMPLGIRIEVNNLQECLDLLRFKLAQELPR